MLNWVRFAKKACPPMTQICIDSGGNLTAEEIRIQELRTADLAPDGWFLPGGSMVSIKFSILGIIA
jgi:hypothetical protein